MPLCRHSVGTYQLVSWCFEPSQGNLSGNELTRNSSGNIRSQSSQLAESLWTDPGLKSGIIVRELISTFKKKKEKKSACGEWIVEHSPKILVLEEKATTTYENVYNAIIFVGAAGSAESFPTGNLSPYFDVGLIFLFFCLPWPRWNRQSSPAHDVCSLFLVLLPIPSAQLRVYEVLFFFLQQAAACW